MTAAVQIVVAAVGALVVFAYVCRLAGLVYGRHKAAWVLMHSALGACAGSGLIHAAYGVMDLQDVVAIAGPGLWIWVSAMEWREGVPRQVHSGPVPLTYSDTLPADYPQG